MDKLQPAMFVIFGTTGDLARKKLFPALFSLFRKQRLDPRTKVLGVGRRDWSDDRFRESVLAAIADEKSDGALKEKFGDLFLYHHLNMIENDNYGSLWPRMDMLDREFDLGGNRVYFLATAPDLFPVISTQIGQNQSPGNGVFRRLMIEKPFGNDLRSAKKFNESLRCCFREQEIFRIDHYLGKEMLQNILVLRFANRLFEPAWNRDHIDHIQITVSEKIGIDQRGAYYEHAGILRDMVQNHLLQLLALLTMEKPESLDSEKIRDAKVSLFRSIRMFRQDRIMEEAVLGQYIEGASGEPGYRAEKNVAPDSQTETFAALTLWIDQDRWRDVPIFIRTGKRMKQRQAQIAIVFRQAAYGPAEQELVPNCLIIQIQPTEGVDLRFNIKQPGTLADILPVNMSFCQTCTFPGQSPEAYERLIYDAWRGDLSLFTRWDEIEATWKIIDSLQELRGSLPLHMYPAGTNGPAAATTLIGRTGRSWLDKQPEFETQNE